MNSIVFKCYAEHFQCFILLLYFYQTFLYLEKYYFSITQFNKLSFNLPGQSAEKVHNGCYNSGKKLANLLKRLGQVYTRLSHVSGYI